MVGFVDVRASVSLCVCVSVRVSVCVAGVLMVMPNIYLFSIAVFRLLDVQPARRVLCFHVGAGLALAPPQTSQTNPRWPVSKLCTYYKSNVIFSVPRKVQ